MRTLKCPNCGADLTIDEQGREYAFCQYCGGKVDLYDKRTYTYHTEHTIDDARILEAEAHLKKIEADLAIREKELTIKEKEIKRLNKKDRWDPKRIIVIFAVLFFVITAIWHFFFPDPTGDIDLIFFVEMYLFFFLIFLWVMSKLNKR